MSDSNRSTSGPFIRLYDRLVLGLPWLWVILCLGVTAFFAYYIKDFKLDASGDSIVLENDRDLRYYNDTRDIFGSDDYVIVMVTPDDDLFSEETLVELKALRDDLAAVQNVDSVISILDVPLFHSPDVPLMQLATGYKTLSGDADPALAERELTNSPFFRNHLISEGGETTAIQVNFTPPPKETEELYALRTNLRDRARDGELSAEEEAQLEAVEDQYAAAHAAQSAARSEDIEALRAIMAKHSGIGQLHIGGVPMVAVDIIEFVQRDIVNFGIGVIIFVLIMMGILFRSLRWILLPTLTAVMTVLIMMGYLGYTNWLMTIVTSNFTSLLLIITIAMAVHVAVRHRELHAKYPDWSKREIIRETVRYVAKPCLYTSLTTMVGFGSLVVSQIRPVMDFGMMMFIGIAVGYVMVFLFLPAALMFFPKGAAPSRALAEVQGASPMAVFARLTERHGRLIAVISIVLFIVCAIGATRLRVENSFIDYFKKDTEIYQGMTTIDQRLGGTTPLEVVLEGEGENYWLEDEHRAELMAVHDWLDEQPEIGKAISPITMLRILEGVNQGKPVPKFMLQAGLAALPPDIKASVITPYMNAGRDKVRISMRVQESDRSLNRKELLDRINAYLDEQEAGTTWEARPTGMFVLYNNLLQSLFTSQILTIGAVFGGIWLMFLALFRSLYLATIAIIPNILPVVLVLGALGWLDIPLDLMTIMIAAVTLGIAVDFAIHYITRFQYEFPEDRSYIATMYRCHNTIGRAMWYTSVTIIVGFSILVLSNFIPTIYFGIFTGLAMLVALLASVTLLPLLIISWKPLGRETSAHVAASE